MRKTTHALAVPAALLLVVGLSACKLPGVSSSSSTETAAPQTENSSSPAPVPTVPPIVSPTGGSNIPTVTPSPTPAKRSVSVTELQVGDCYAEPDASSTQDSDVDVVDCATPHQHEVYSTYTITSSTFPTGDDMDTEVDNACYDSFTSYIGVDVNSSSYGTLIYKPTSISWNFGNHQITCAVSPNRDENDTTSTLTGSVKDTAK